MGIPMIVHVWKRAVEANVGKVLVAAAENEIADVIRSHGGDALATDPALRSGSDRVAAALKLRDPQGNFTAVINLQGDLPTIDPLAIQRCLAGLTNETVDIATIAARIEAMRMSRTRMSLRQLPPSAKAVRWLTSAISCAHRAPSMTRPSGATSTSMPTGARRWTALPACP